MYLPHVLSPIHHTIHVFCNPFRVAGFPHSTNSFIRLQFIFLSVVVSCDERIKSKLFAHSQPDTGKALKNIVQRMLSHMYDECATKYNVMAECFEWNSISTVFSVMAKQSEWNVFYVICIERSSIILFTTQHFAFSVKYPA